MAFSTVSDTEAPLQNDVVDGSVTFNGRPVSRSKSGGWKSAGFVIGVEVAERISYYGIGSNLISYLTGPLGQSTATAAANVNAWHGTASLLPLLGAFLADSFFGRYRMIIWASVLYALGLGFLSLSAVLFDSSDCQTAPNNISSCSPPRLKVILFFFSLYLVALAQGGHKPCVQAFGADQFDESDPEECKAKSSFFNWWYFSFCAGIMVALFGLNYIQDNLSWGLGFGIPCIVMLIALVVFLLGTYSYRLRVHNEERNPFLRIGQVFVRAARNWQTTSSALSMEEESQGILPDRGSQQFKFLNKALLTPGGSNQYGRVCSMTDIEDAKSVLRLIPIWSTCLVYAIVFSQSSTLFTKQGVTMDRHITPTFQIPAASLQSFISLTIVLFVPIYDQILVPTARSLTRKPSGITMLQRIGTGIFLSTSMLIAALVEKKRLEIAREYGLIDLPKAKVPMSVWWLIPQYLLFGVSDVFTMVGLQEFFYDQVPSELKSVGLALYLSIFGIGSFLSSFLISVIEKATSDEQGRDNWFSDNLNRAHIDYFYWLLAGFSATGFMAYLWFAKSYIYNRRSDFIASKLTIG